MVLSRQLAGVVAAGVIVAGVVVAGVMTLLMGLWPLDSKPIDQELWSPKAPWVTHGKMLPNTQVSWVNVLREFV